MASGDKNENCFRPMLAHVTFLLNRIKQSDSEPLSK